MPNRRVVSPTGKAKVLTPVRANVGIEANYRRKLDALIAEMHNSLLHWIGAEYKRSTPEVAELAQDEIPAAVLRALMKRLSRRWLKRFDEAAVELSNYFAQSAYKRSDASLKAILKRAGFTVEFSLTPAQRDILSASIAQNVSLIKSIAQQHIEQVEGVVMRAVMNGGQWHTVTEQLQKRYSISRNHAAVIANHQNSMLTASLTRARFLELGITEAIWRHSSAGRYPRKSHVEAGKKKLRFDVAKGAYLDGAFVQPGALINCRCTAAPILPGE